MQLKTPSNNRHKMQLRFKLSHSNESVMRKFVHMSFFLQTVEYHDTFHPIHPPYSPVHMPHLFLTHGYSSLEGAACARENTVICGCDTVFVAVFDLPSVILLSRNNNYNNDKKNEKHSGWQAPSY